MGYYSEVMIACEEKAYKKLREVIAKHEYIKPDEDLFSKSAKNHILIWYSVKWYENAFDDVDAIMDKLKEFDQKEDTEIGYNYAFLRIGESLEDNEERYKGEMYDFQIRRTFDNIPYDAEEVVQK